MKKQPVYDPEELKLLEEIERGEWQTKPLTAKEKKRYSQIRRLHAKSGRETPNNHPVRPKRSGRREGQI